MLELDPRCTQIATFALALAAWRSGGYRPLPTSNIACSGIAVTGQLEDWLRLAGGDERLSTALERLYKLFRDAPTLGSLINPADVPLNERMFSADYEEVAPLLEKALAVERDDPAATVLGAAAEGVAKAAKLLAGHYTLVATNVPYLGRGKQDEVLYNFCEEHYPEGKNDLATVFVERCRLLSSPSGAYAVISPHNWRFLQSYKRLRIKLLKEQTWNLIVNLGPKAFRTPMWDFNVGFSILSNCPASTTHLIIGLDASTPKSSEDKAAQLCTDALQSTVQMAQINNRNASISFAHATRAALLSDYVSVHYGSKPGQTSRVTRFFWELPVIDQTTWVFMESTPNNTAIYTGKSEIALSLDAITALEIAEFGVRGREAWGRLGVILSQMATLPCSIYLGSFFDNNTSVLIPGNPSDLQAIFAFMRSGEFATQVRLRNQKIDIDTGSMVNIPFDLADWQSVADFAGPLPEPSSNDPTQWLFGGHPVGATEPLHVAVARLLGYRWPQQAQDDLGAHADADGIVCLPAVAGEAPAAERLRGLLAAAYGGAWSATEQERLLASVGFTGKTLDDWLAAGFFPQHCRLFHNRPFIWHIWDGRKDGFAALVNYHKLDRARLEKLTYTYLGAWINRQRDERDAGVAAADGRLVAALELQKKLIAILDGEPPYDIYVRWKPLNQQPIGWAPDLDDGVRLNIRPFVTAGVLRSRFTVHWKVDRGKNPDGSARVNDLHKTRSEKQAARAEAGQL